LQYEEKNWDKFCDEMLTLVKIQYQELEKAVVCTGKHHFQAKFTHLEKPLAVWIKMSVEQRKRHIKKVMCVKMNDTSLNDSDDDTTKTGSSSCSLPAPSNVCS